MPYFSRALIGVLRAVGGDPLVAPDGLKGLQAVLFGDAVGPQQLLHRPLGRFDEGQKQMLHRDVLILHPGGQAFGLPEHLVHPLGNIEFVRLPAAGDPGQLLQLPPGGGLQALHGDAQLPQNLRGQAVVLLQQGQQQVDLLHLLVAVFSGDGLSALHSLQRFSRILIKIHSSCSFHSPLGCLLALGLGEC